METFIRVTQFFLSLSLLVLLHEWGHFIAARMFKTRVEKFYLFFDFLFPFPKLLNFALFKKKIGDTEYGLGWFPMGGYVSIAGMMDETKDSGDLDSTPKPDEYRSKKAWQRLIILLGGIIVNLILAFFIYSMLLFAYGKETIPMENAKYGFVADSLAQSIGFKSGDIMVGYDNKQKFTDAGTSVVVDLLLADAQNVQVLRNGQPLSIDIPDYVYPAIVNSRGEIEFLKIAFPSDIDSVLPQSPVYGKMQKGDRVINVAGTPINYFAEIGQVLKQNRSKTIPVTVLRGTDTVTMQAAIPAEAKLNIAAVSPENYFEVKKTSYGFLASFPAGFVMCKEVLTKYIKQFRLIFSPRFKGWKQVGGFASISKLYTTYWDWQAFWMSTAFLSLVLAFMNLLPIPMLDGGYALFTLVEMIIGRPLPEKFLEYSQMIGMVFILTLLVVANGNDLLRALFGN
ncbi:MAG TPA: RIP metalloprotease RseP [Chitinophagales bacterium]|nr:RIP metalloprotease RseP [Chitinophagales bacterium]